MDYDELVQRELQCPVCREEFCFGEYKYPRLLPCLHIIGTNCLNGCVNDDKLTCPVCAEHFELKDKNIDHLPKDYSRQNLAMYLKIKRSENVFHCEEHESMKASVCCQTCGQFICETCSYVHTKKGHFVSPLEDLAGLPIPELYGRKVCDVYGHGDKHIEFFCITCRKLICPKCYLEQHSTHKLENYEIVYERQFAKLEGECKKITEIKQMTEKFDAAADGELKALDLVADTELEKVRCTFNNHKLALDKRKRVLDSQIKGTRDGKKECLKRQQQYLKNTGKTLNGTLNRALDFLAFSNKQTFITNFDLVETRVLKAKEIKIDTALSEQALLLFLETKGNKRFENETETLGKIWPGKIHIPNLRYTIHPVMLSTECLLVSIQFVDKHGEIVGVKDIKQYIDSFLLNGKGEKVDRAITKMDINEDDTLTITGHVHEPGKYRLMAFIANVSLKQGGFIIQTGVTEDQQNFGEVVDLADTQILVETKDILEKLHKAEIEDKIVTKVDSFGNDIGHGGSVVNKTISSMSDYDVQATTAAVGDADKELLDMKIESSDKESTNEEGAVGGKGYYVQKDITEDSELLMDGLTKDEAGDGLSSPDHFTSCSDSGSEEEFSTSRY